MFKIVNIFILCLFFTNSVVYAESISNKKSHLVVDVNNGEFLEENNAFEQRYPASLTKVMTLYIVFEELNSGRLSMDSLIPISKNASSKPASKLYMKTGSSISVENAINALIINSANDIAVAVAEKISGTEEKFAQRMTATAKVLGMVRTEFRNASGLPNSEQVTSAHDMYLLALAIQDSFPQYYKFFNKEKWTYMGKTYSTHNHLVKLDGVDGLKTGYISASGYNLITNYKKNGKHLIGVVLGQDSSANRNKFMVSILQSAAKIAYAGARKTEKYFLAESVRLEDAFVGSAMFIPKKPDRVFLMRENDMLSANIKKINQEFKSREHFNGILSFPEAD